MNREFIVEKIKLNRRYVTNEDLLDSFVDAVLHNIDGIFSSIRDEEILNIYLDKVVTKSIIEVLKQYNRYKKVNKLQKVDYKSFDFDTASHRVPMIPISKLKQLYTILKNNDEKEGTIFLDIMNLKYKENKNVKEISEILNLSQDEVVSILFDMSDYANKVAKI